MFSVRSCNTGCDKLFRITNTPITSSRTTTATKKATEIHETVGYNPNNFNSGNTTAAAVALSVIMAITATITFSYILSLLHCP